MAQPTDTRCHTQALVSALPQRVQARLNVALSAPHVTTSAILAVLEDHGVTGARAENVNRHRRRLQGGNYACKCPLPTEAPS